jgi:hypothetical protein
VQGQRCRKLGMYGTSAGTEDVGMYAMSAGAAMPGTISVTMLGRFEESLFETSRGSVEMEGSRR